jgi:hypothetical protein
LPPTRRCTSENACQQFVTGAVSADTRVGYFAMMTDLSPDEPIGEDVPLADAVEQRREVGETRGLAEDFEPTVVDRMAGEPAPLDADPADWQEQRTDADEGWDADVDR